jgi:hypothetical protein
MYPGRSPKNMKIRRLFYIRRKPEFILADTEIGKNTYKGVELP